MSKVIVGIIGLVVGAFGGAFVGGTLVGGTAAGIGVGTGLSAGICSTVQAAQEEGFLTAEQVDQVLARAAADMAGSEGLPAGTSIVGGAAECADVMEALQATAE